MVLRPEKKSQAYSYGFICAFSDSDALASYASDERHQALGRRLVALVGGDVDNIWVADIDTQAGQI